MEREFYGTDGTSIARPVSMARRIVAFLAMVAIVLIVVSVMWRIYRHHVSSAPNDEPTIVSLGGSKS